MTETVSAVVAVDQQESLPTSDSIVGKGPAIWQSSRLISLLDRCAKQSRELVAYLIAFLLIYSVCYVVPYGFADDYAFLYSGETRTFTGQFAGVVEYGRPLQAYLYQWTFSAMHDLTDLRYLRLISVVGIALCAWLFYLALRRTGLAFWPAFLIPVVAFSLPSYQVLAAWASCAYYGWAALLAGGALLVTDRAFDRRYSRHFFLLIFLAIAMVVGSLFVYQPSGTMFWLFAAVTLLVRQLDMKEMAKRFGLYLAVAAPAFLLAYESLRIVPTLILGQDVATPRSQLVQDIPGKLLWFVQQPLANSLNLTDIDPTYLNALLIGLFVLGGLCLFFKGNIQSRLLRLAVALSLVPLTYLPNLVVADDWASYRTLIVLGPLVALYYALAILGFVGLLDYVSLRRLKSAAIILPLGTFALFSALSAAKNVAVEFALPQYTELQFLNGQLQPEMQQHAKVVYFVNSSWTDSIAPLVRYDEFGLPSSVDSWTPQGMVYLTLQQSDSADENVQVQVISESAITTLPKGSIVVDMHGLQYDRLILPSASSASRYVAYGGR